MQSFIKTMSARFLMIALDGADGILLDRWSADGTLPNLAALRARGGANRLTAPPGITDDALWASFQYSASLGEHGRYHFRQRLDTGEMDMAYLGETDRRFFWEALSAQGLQVGILDVPKCGLPRPINGIHLVDWLVHGRYFSEPKSYPESLAAEIVERFGPAPPSRCDYEGPQLNGEEVREVTSNLRTSIERKRAAGLHHLDSRRWDLFVIGFKEAHCAGHHFWDLADPDHDPTRAASLGEPLRTIFMDLDAAVGDLAAAAGPDAAITVFSTTDMEPNATLAHLMPGVVHRLNAYFGETLLTRTLRRVTRRCLSTALPVLPCELLPYNENCTALRVSPRWGLLSGTPGYERRKARMLDRMGSLLRELVDADTGQPVIFAIDRPAAEYTGQRASALPDMLIRYSAGTFPRAVISPQLGRIEAERPLVRPGNHASGGFQIFAGDAVGVERMEDLGSMATRLLSPGEMNRHIIPRASKSDSAAR
jgi:hypothetical protein